MGRKKKIQKNEEESEIQESRIRFNLASDAKRSAVAIALFALAILIVLGFFGKAGMVGQFFDKMVASAVGWVKFIFPAFLAASGVIFLFRKKTVFYVAKTAGLFFMLMSLTGIFHWFFPLEEILPAAVAGQGGGYLGYALVYILEKYLGNAGSLVVILAMLFIGIIAAFNFSIINLFSKLKKENLEEVPAETEEKTEGVAVSPENAPVPSPDANPVPPVPAEKEPDAQNNIGRVEFVDDGDPFTSEEAQPENYLEPSLSRANAFSRKSINSSYTAGEKGLAKNLKGKKWILPPADMLERSYGAAKGGDIDKNFDIIIKTLKDFGIVVEKGGAQTGPAVTQYSFRPAVGVKIAKILALQNDLSLALAAHPIRIEAPIPGQSLIGIEIPNKTSLTVRLRNMIDSPQFKKRETNLTLALGEDVSGNPVFSDLSKMPHLMIAGATGTGKSVSINSIITTLLYQNSPEDLKFIMVDPKRVELSIYNGIPHLLTDVVVENGKVINVLKWAVGEMERRYRLLQDTGSRDISSYGEKMRTGHKIKHTDPETNKTVEEDLKNLPYIVIVIDELADLMGSHGKEVEGAIVRIAQMARAVGIHLIVSTQRPSVEVITGLIKANITTRIAFQVATQIDSRTIIDMGGAEKLLGNGDMLYLSASSPKPRRIQGVFVSESEVKRVVKFINDQKKNKETEEEKEEKDIAENSQKEILEFKGEDADGEEDNMLEAAKAEVIRAKKASASLLQRRLRIGYARAARMLDILEEKGIVGPADGAKPREVYVAEEAKNVEYADPIEDQEKRDKWQLQ